MKSEQPWCIAHRGAREESPENTLAAFRQALTYPIDGIEFDVQLSADGVAVLYHDRTLKKVGGGHKRISDLTAEDLARQDWGRWFHTDFAGEPMPTLDKALDLLARCPRILIEIKTHPDDHTAAHTRRLTETVIRLIDRPDISPVRGRIMVLSFDPSVLRMAHQLAPDLPYVLNYPEKNTAGALDDTDHLTAVDVNIGKLTIRLAQQIRSQNLNLFTYTCNTPRQVDKALNLNVDAIISDRPGWLAGYLVDSLIC